MRFRPPRKPPARAERRVRARTQAKLVRDLEQLARLEVGGTPERPIVIASPAQVEVMAGARACPLCEGPLRVEEHAAETLSGTRLRVARVACTACGTRRSIYFRLEVEPIH